MAFDPGKIPKIRKDTNVKVYIITEICEAILSLKKKFFD